MVLVFVSISHLSLPFCVHSIFTPSILNGILHTHTGEYINMHFSLSPINEKESLSKSRIDTSKSSRDEQN